MYIPIQNGFNNGLTDGDINNTEENCKNFNINLSKRKTGVEETKKDISVLGDDHTLTSARGYNKGCQSSSVNYERQTHSEDEKDSSLQHVRVPAESDKVAPKIAGSFGKKWELDKIDEAGRVKEERTGLILSGEKEGRTNNMMTQMSANRKTLPKKESLYQKKSVVGNTRKVKIHMNYYSGLLIFCSFPCQISREDCYIVMEQCQDFKQKFRLTTSDLEKLIELGY